MSRVTRAASRAMSPGAAGRHSLKLTQKILEPGSVKKSLMPETQLREIASHGALSALSFSPALRSGKSLTKNAAPSLYNCIFHENDPSAPPPLHAPQTRLARLPPGTVRAGEKRVQKNGG